MSKSVSTTLITEHGEFLVCYHSIGNEFAVSLSIGDLSISETMVRIHSSCLFSEAFHSIDCDCDMQLDNAMRVIAKEERGVIIYLYQEGRGHGLLNKIRAMELERSENIDTAEAFTRLHFDLDPRDYTVAIQALKDLEVNRNIKLITNNPRKASQLESAGFSIGGYVKLRYPVNKHVKHYLKAKKEKLGHNILPSLIE